MKVFAYRKWSLVFRSLHYIREKASLYNPASTGREHLHVLARYNNFKPFRLDLLDTLVNTIPKHKNRLMFRGLNALSETIITMFANIRAAERCVGKAGRLGCFSRMGGFNYMLHNLR